MPGYYYGKMFGSQTHNPHSVGRPFQEQEAPRPHSLNHSSHGDRRGRGISEMKSSQAIRLLPLSLRRQTQTQLQHTDICCDRGSPGCWVAPRGHLARLGAQGRLPDETRPELSPKQEAGLSRKQHQEQVRRGSSSNCKKTGGREPVWLIRETVELLGQATQHPLYIHLPLPSLGGFDSDLIPYRYEQRLKCKPELNRVMRNEKLADGYLLEMKAATFYNIS